MAASYLTTVPASGAEPPKGGVVDIGRGGDMTALRIRQLQLEARALGREQVEAFARDLGALASRAAEITAGGDAYPVGARELAGRLADDLPGKVQLLLTLARREG